jgi:hypothetical protein
MAILVLCVRMIVTDAPDLFYGHMAIGEYIKQRMKTVEYKDMRRLLSTFGFSSQFSRMPWA